MDLCRRPDECHGKSDIHTTHIGGGGGVLSTITNLVSEDVSKIKRQRDPSETMLRLFLAGIRLRRISLL